MAGVPYTRVLLSMGARAVVAGDGVGEGCARCLCGAEGEVGVGAGDALGVGAGDVVGVGTGEALGVVAGDMPGVEAWGAPGVGARGALGVVAADGLGVGAGDGRGLVCGEEALGFGTGDALGARVGCVPGLEVGEALGVGAVDVLGVRVGVGTGGAPRPMTAAAPTTARAIARRHLADDGRRFKCSYLVIRHGQAGEVAYRRGSGVPLRRPRGRVDAWYGLGRTPGCRSAVRLPCFERWPMRRVLPSNHSKREHYRRIHRANSSVPLAGSPRIGDLAG
jgi:hypothetical protein